MEIEIILASDFSVRGRKIVQAMINAAPQDVIVHVSDCWQRKAPILMTYGLGHMVRRHWTEEHLRCGGRIIGWDLGYWNRDVSLNFSMRVTIDSDHPWRLIGPMPAHRWDSAQIALREDFDPRGHIVLCGSGWKQRRWKQAGRDWEDEKASELKRRFPGRRIVYRPKRPEKAPDGLEVMDEGDIEDVLRGAALVVCGHSNVAVDACIAGVPVECEDGAAYALYRHGSAPSREQRLEFLRSLAWWQWRCSEASEAWEFLKAQLQ